MSGFVHNLLKIFEIIIYETSKMDYSQILFFNIVCTI